MPPSLTGEDLAFQPITVLAAEIAAGRLSPADVVDNALDRIARLDGKLHAFVEVHADEARAAARAADALIRAGHRIGPLHGIPIAVKDLVEIEGRITTGGSAAWRERRSTRTAAIVRRLLGAGMIVLGKTHTVEFAFGAWGTNRHMGTPWNPWDLMTHRVPGGSSSGTGVAVAAGLAPCGIGTDTGGSVRIPAAYCGVVGLKTTVGQISTEGVLALSTTLDSVGPLARCVADAALVYEALRGADPIDRLLPAIARPITGFRLAALPAEMRGEFSDAVNSAYDAALATLAGLGASVAEIAMPRPFGGYRDMVGTVIAVEGYAETAALVDDEAAPLDPAVRPRMLGGKRASGRDYLLALRDREAAKREFAAAFDGFSALVMPTLAAPAIPVAEVDERVTPAVTTRWVNALDLCGVSVPCGFSPEGLPIGLQVVARGHDEATALRVAAAYERATPSHEARPKGL